MNSQEFLQFRQRMKSELATLFGKANVCPFWGNQHTKIVSISQAPSSRVIKYQKPFFDKSGERLRRKWYKVSDKVFYNPDNFYFTAIGMYFPGKDKNGGDKKPSLALAKKWLPKELSFLNPKLFLIIGTLSAKFFFPKKTLTELVFEDQKVNNRPAVVLPHPSPLNIKWFKDHPEFEEKRIPIIRSYVHEALGISNKVIQPSTNYKF